MFRRLAIQSLEDRRLLAAQPVLSANSILQALVQPALESRLERTEVSVDLSANAVRKRMDSVIVTMPLARGQVSHELSQAGDAFTELGFSSLIRSSTDVTSRSVQDISSIGERLERQIGPLRPLIQEALSSPPSSDARRELLKTSEQLLARAIEHIDTDGALQGSIAANLEAPPAIAAAIRTQVRDRLETRQVDIASILQADLDLQGQPIDSADEQAEWFEPTTNSLDTLPSEFGSKMHELNNADLEASYAPDKPVLGNIFETNAADSIDMDGLLAPKPQTSLGSQTPASEPEAAAVVDRSDAVFAEYDAPTTVNRYEQQVAIEIGEIVGRVSSLDLLSALDATASEIRETVDELRPRISVPVAASISALTVSFLVRIQKRRLKNLEKEIDVDCATVKLADKVPQPSLGM